MSFRQIKVNGTSLHSMAYQVDLIDGRRGIPGRVNSDMSALGVAPAAIDAPWIPPTWALQLWVDGHDPTTGDGSDALYEQRYDRNLSTVLQTFVSRSNRLNVEAEAGDGKIWKAVCRLVAAAPAVETFGTRRPVARITIPLDIPDFFWTGNNLSQTWTANTTQSLTTNPLGGVIDDAILKITGPATNPTITDPDDTAVQLRLTGTIPAGDTLTIDCGKWTAVNNAAASRIRELTYRGSGHRLLSIAPPYRLRFAASSTTSATTLVVTAVEKLI